MPRDKWRSLMIARKYFLAVKLSHDCSCLVQFVDDARIMHQELGFASAEDMVRDGYGLEPAEITLAVEWLRLNPPDEPLPLDEAKELARKAQGPRDEKGRFIRSDNITSGKRGTSASYTKKRLKRDHPELYACVEAGVMSANAAAEAAGFRKKRRCPHCGGEL